MVNGLTVSSGVAYSFSGSIRESRQKSSEALRKIEQNSSSFREAMAVNLDAVLSKIQSQANIFNRKLTFFVHKSLNRVVIRVVDGETNQVIRQLPPDQILHMMEEIRKSSGVFLDRSS